MQIEKIINPLAQENTYFLSSDTGLLLVDPGNDTQAILDKITHYQLPLIAILLTHTHYDHIWSLDAIRSQYPDVAVYVSELESTWLYTPELNLTGLPHHDDWDNLILQPADHFFEFNKTYTLANMRFKVLATPGHSIGGVSFVFDDDKLVLTGDALFSGTIGRTDLPTGSMPQLLNSVKTQLLALPSDYQVYPGHGPATSIGHERLYNPFFQEQ